MAYDDPAGLIAMSVIIEALAIGAVSLRFMSRRKMRAGLRADDWLALGALMLGTGLCIIEIYGVAMEAFGCPMSTGTRSIYSRYRKGLDLEFAFLLLNIIALAMIKISSVFLYRRLFMTFGSFATISLVWIFILLSWGITFSMWLIFQCGSHVEALFTTFEDYEQYCQKNNSAGYVLAFTDLITDLVTLIMPLPMVVKLQLSLRRKVAIATVFAIGVFTVVASAVRAAIYVQAQQDVDGDGLVMMTKLSVWNYLEVMIGVCATCAITFRPVFADINLKAYVFSLPWSGEGYLSSIFSKRNSQSSSDSEGSSEVRNKSEKLAQGFVVEIKSVDSQTSTSTDTV